MCYRHWIHREKTVSFVTGHAASLNQFIWFFDLFIFSHAWENIETRMILKSYPHGGIIIAKKSTRHWPDDEPMLGHRLRRWPNISPSSGQSLVLAWWFLTIIYVTRWSPHTTVQAFIGSLARGAGHASVGGTKTDCSYPAYMGHWHSIDWMTTHYLRHRAIILPMLVHLLTNEGIQWPNAIISAR